MDRPDRLGRPAGVWRRWRPVRPARAARIRVTSSIGTDHLLGSATFLLAVVRAEPSFLWLSAKRPAMYRPQDGTSSLEDIGDARYARCSVARTETRTGG